MDKFPHHQQPSEHSNGNGNGHYSPSNHHHNNHNHRNRRKGTFHDDCCEGNHSTSVRHSPRGMKPQPKPLRILTALTIRFQRARQHSRFLHILLCLSVLINLSFFYEATQHFPSHEDARSFLLPPPLHMLYNDDGTGTAKELSTYAHDARMMLSTDAFTETVRVTPAILKMVSDETPDYDGLKLTFLSSTRFDRTIREDSNKYYEKKIEHPRRDVQTNDYHLAVLFRRFDELYTKPDCLQPSWSFYQYPVCNNFHQMHLLESILSRDDMIKAEYINSGYYRDSWKMIPDQKFFYVLKTLRERHDYSLEDLRKIQLEAISMERLTASSRTMNIYGHCGAAIYVEPGEEVTPFIVPGSGWMSHDEAEKFKKEHNRLSINELTPEQKLDYALEMAEGLAEIHGFEGGVITNNDVHSDQWLRSKIDGRVKLNDFNNGAILEWNEDQQDYCPFYSSFGGTEHAPEEYYARILEGDQAWIPRVTEKSDVFDMGTVMYNILTGLWSFYDSASSKDVQRALVKGDRGWIDHRFQTSSFIEQRLVYIIKKAWEGDQNKRIDIFHIVKYLRETKEMVKKQKGVRRRQDE